MEITYPDYTPCEKRGPYWLKRDDLFSVADVCGGKVRTCWHLSQGARGLITAGSRSSPQCEIVAHVAKQLKVPCRVHTTTGVLGPELVSAADAGAEVVQHKAGYNNVLIARARQDAVQRKWTEIPFGMECAQAVKKTSLQLDNLPFGEFSRLVVPVGSGMTLVGVLVGLARVCAANGGPKWPRVLGVQVGACPVKRLSKWAYPLNGCWQSRVTLVKSLDPYSKESTENTLEGLLLDPYYEAKCLPFLEPGDLLWVVGVRRRFSR